MTFATVHEREAMAGDSAPRRLQSRYE